MLHFLSKLMQAANCVYGFDGIIYVAKVKKVVQRFIQPPYTELVVLFMKFPTRVQTYPNYNKRMLI